MLTKFGGLLKATYKEWSDRDPFNKSVVIAYYAIFSLPGLLVIIITVAGSFYGNDAVTERITAQIQGMVGGDTAEDIRNIIGKASETKGSTLASVLGIATLLFGATGVFYQVQRILNEMWEVKPEPKQKLLKIVRDRVFSFGLILIIGFLLLISLVISAALSAVSEWISGNLTESLVAFLKVIDMIISIGVITVLFAAIYKFLPDAKIRWRDVWVGAFVTALLFVVAKYALGLYFGKSDPGSTYGAAGSIILIMLWVSYAGMILLFGAEFTKVYANRYGAKVKPTEGAVSTNPGQNTTRSQPANGPARSKQREKEPPMQQRTFKGSPWLRTR